LTPTIRRGRLRGTIVIRIEAMLQLTRAAARRIAVQAQLLDAQPATELLDVVRQLTLLQVQSTATIAPSAELVAWSRLGSSFAPAELEDARAGGALVELRGMLRPSEDVALYRADMARWDTAKRGDPPGWRASQRDWVRANDACRRDLLARLDAAGPLPARELPDTCAVPWRSSGWNNDRNVTLLLEFMEQRGEVAVAGRSHRERLWGLAERIYPDDPIVPAAQATTRRNELRLRSLGIARGQGPECPVEPQDVGEVGEPAVIEGIKGTWRVDPSLLDRPFTGRVALLSPFDRLVYDRKRVRELFGFDYQLEMFKPAAKRRWGYYALPILAGDQLVGKLDATADRNAGELRVDAIHQDVAFSEELLAAVHREIDDLAAWLGLTAPALR
jgi:uncharacterized protein